MHLDQITLKARISNHIGMRVAKIWIHNGRWVAYVPGIGRRSVSYLLKRYAR